MCEFAICPELKYKGEKKNLNQYFLTSVGKLPESFPIFWPQIFFEMTSNYIFLHVVYTNTISSRATQKF